MITGYFTRFRNAFAIDLEVLAIFRLLLALIVLWGLLGRIQVREYLFSLEPPTANLEQEDADSSDFSLYSSRDSRSVWTAWHWSVMWLDQVVEQTHVTILNVQHVEPGPDVSGPDPTTTPLPVFHKWHVPLQNMTTFLASRLWFDCVIGAGIASAILFGLGLFTKTSNLLLWVVVVSVQHRMPLFNSGADSLERLFLFWMLFLPAGAVFSLDAWWFPRQGFWRKRINQTQSLRYQNHLTSGQPLLLSHSICNWATAAILVQLIAIYWYSALEKWNADWWAGTAVESALQWDFITKPLATVWLSQSDGLRIVTWSVLAMELLCPLLVFCPGLFGWTRRATAYFFLIMHLGIAVSLTIGSFSAVCMAGWWLFIAWPRGPAGGWRNFWLDLRDQPRELASLLPSSSRASATAAEWIVIILMFLTIWWNLSHASLLSRWIKFPRAMQPVVCQLGLDPNFPMFGRVPQHNYGWVHRVELESGATFDLRRELPAPLNVSNRITTWSEPHGVYLWRQLHVNLLYLEAQQSDFVQLVRERLHELELHTWREKVRTAGKFSAHEIDSAYSMLLMVDQETGEDAAAGEASWGFTDL
jgi:hypothetical protein